MKHKIFTEADLDTLRPFAEEGYFEEALAEQIDGKRLVFVSYGEGGLEGYVHYNRFPRYQPFLKLGIPEIQDLFVLPDFRRHGVGQALVQTCIDQAMADQKEEIGIGVGVSSNFGSAQRLYTRMGFIPDGAGIVFDRVPVRSGDIKPVDDRLCLMLIKPL